MKYGRKKEFVDAEIEARMGIGNLNAIEDAAKKDPTVPDQLLSNNPVAPQEAPPGQSIAQAVTQTESSQAAAIPEAAKVPPPTPASKSLS